MKKYAKVINEETKECEVGLGTNTKFYQSIGMIEQDVEQAYDGAWYLKGYAPQKPQELVIKEYEAAIDNLLLTTANSRGYDSAYTCLSYLQSSNAIWKTEAEAFNTWRDACWVKAHEILNQWQAGEIEQPTVEEVLAQMPAIGW